MCVNITRVCLLVGTLLYRRGHFHIARRASPKESHFVDMRLPKYEIIYKVLFVCHAETQFDIQTPNNNHIVAVYTAIYSCSVNHRISNDIYSEMCMEN